MLPGNVQAYLDTPIYARTNGYLRKWYVDIGGRVKAGQLLAEIETPEIDQELHQAQAAQLQAEANLDLAKTTADRWQNLLKSDGVSQQEVDQNVSAFHAREADLQAAKANVQRLKDLQSFQKVTAPFDGIVTARNVDVGALIANGNARAAFPHGANQRAANLRAGAADLQPLDSAGRAGHADAFRNFRTANFRAK